MAWKKKKAKDARADRVIPEADLTNLVVPSFTSQKKLSDKDRGILKKFSHELIETGVLDKESNESAYTLTDEQDSVIFNAGAAGEKNVKKLKSQSLDAQNFLSSRELDEGDRFDNPSLDGIDDYGDQVYDVYEDSLPSLGSLLDDHISLGTEGSTDFNSDLNIRLPDGSFIIGEIPGYKE